MFCRGRGRRVLLPTFSQRALAGSKFPAAPTQASTADSKMADFEQLLSNAERRLTQRRGGRGNSQRQEHFPPAQAPPASNQRAASQRDRRRSGSFGSATVHQAASAEPAVTTTRPDIGSKVPFEAFAACAE